MEAFKVGRFLSKLLLEDDESDIIRFAFANDTRKIRCSKSFLSKISPVFQKMLSKTWLKESTIKLNDLAVAFDQYSTFKMFLEIAYEICDLRHLTTHQLKSAYYYAHKYEVIIAKTQIEAHLKHRVGKKPLSMAELLDGLQFAEFYQVKNLRRKLSNVKVALDEKNARQFFDLAVEFNLYALKEQVIDHLKTIEPNDTWTHEMSNSVVKSFQKECKKREERKELAKKSMHADLVEVLSLNYYKNHLTRPNLLA